MPAFFPVAPGSRWLCRPVALPAGGDGVGAAGHTAAMAYDSDLAERVRAIVATEPGITERRMFGGLAFLAGGHLAVSASGRGGLMVRVDPASTDALLDEPRVTRFVMRGRALDGWLHVRPAPEDDAGLRHWVQHGLAHARSLPPR